LLKQLGYVIKHPDFEDKYNGLFAKEGALETFFSNPNCHVYN
jgi:hypothetical protein